MKYMKMLGLLAVAAAALMAFVGTASATVTSPAGTAYAGNIVSSSSNTSLDGSVKVSCTSSTVEGDPSSAGATSGTISKLTFANCGNDTVKVNANGSLAISSSGTVTSTGAEVTVQLHRTVLGFPVTTHCIYKTNNTSVGTLTEGVSPAVLHIGSSPIPEVATDGACGNDAVWTGSYTVSTPSGAITVD
jgi:hypothetical protein